MTQQYAEGFVRLRTGSNEVRGSWSATLSGITGSFIPGEDFTISSPAATGQILTVEGGVLLYFFVLTGAPASGHVITGVTSGATATLNGPQPQMDWTNPLHANPGAVFVVSNFKLVIQVAGISAPDLLTLVIDWPDVDLTGARYSINEDFTTFHGLARLQPGNIHSAQLMTRNMDKIDSLLTAASNKLTVGGPGAPGFNTNWAQAGSPYRDLHFWRDYAGIVHLFGSIRNTVNSAPSDAFTMPATFRPGGDLIAEFPTTSGNRARVSIGTDGVVTVEAGLLNPVHFNLQYPAEN